MAIEDNYYQHGSTAETGVNTNAHLVNAYLESTNSNTSKITDPFFSKYGVSKISDFNNNTTAFNKFIADNGGNADALKTSLQGKKTTPGSGVTAEMRANDPSAADALYQIADTGVSPNKQQINQATNGQPVAPQAPATAAPQQTSTAAGTPSILPPSMSLQPGMVGDNVKALQDYLVSQGLLQQADLAGGYGTYGTKTTAAVQALQNSLGVDNSSGPGYFGPKTIAALKAAGGGAAPGAAPTNPSGITTGGTAPAPSNNSADTSANSSAVATQVKMYQEASTALGLPTIKQQYEDYAKEQADLQDELDGKKEDNQNNPWLAQGVVDKLNSQLDSKYDTRLKTLSNLMTLTDSLYKQGQAQVENIVTKADADVAATNKLAQDQLDAAASLAKDNIVVIENGRQYLVSKSTGVKVADLGVDPNPPSKTGPTGTAAERQAAVIDQYSNAFSPGVKLAGGIPTLDSSGQITPEAWKSAISEAPSKGVTRALFITNFGPNILSPDGTVSPKYGLTPAEVKTLGATLRT